MVVKTTGTYPAPSFFGIQAEPTGNRYRIYVLKDLMIPEIRPTTEFYVSSYFLFCCPLILYEICNN